MHQLNTAPAAGFAPILLHGNYDAAALEVCMPQFLTAPTVIKGERQSFGDYLNEWLKHSTTGAKNLVDQVKVGATKVLSRQEIYNYTECEVCKFLNRAIYMISSGVEDQFLSDRLEPWIGLARPISHNLDTRIYYWPEIEI